MFLYLIFFFKLIAAIYLKHLLSSIYQEDSWSCHFFLSRKDRLWMQNQRVVKYSLTTLNRFICPWIWQSVFFFFLTLWWMWPSGTMHNRQNKQHAVNVYSMFILVIFHPSIHLITHLFILMVILTTISFIICLLFPFIFLPMFVSNCVLFILLGLILYITMEFKEYWIHNNGLQSLYPTLSY